jgi:hypothetical protein
MGNGDLRVPQKGAHTGAPLRFAGKFLTVTRCYNPLGPMMRPATAEAAVTAGLAR